MSTRAQVPAGDTAIAGFIICGTAPKHLVLRALGPSLADHGVANALPDPTLELRDSNGTTLIVNDDWKDDVAQRQAIEHEDMIAPSKDKESAIDVIIDPGAYTAIVRGKGKESGIALVEVYDFNYGAESKLSNISTRALVGTDQNIVIAGFILGNNAGLDQLVLRGMGPSTGLPNALQNPQLELRNKNGVSLASNDNWADSPQAKEVQDAGLAPGDGRESAISIALLPDAYTALLSGVNNSTGPGLVEIYDLGTSSAPVAVDVNRIQTGTTTTVEKQHVSFHTVRCIDTFRITVHKPATINNSAIGARAALEGQTAAIPFSASAADIVAAIEAIEKSWYAYGQFGNLELDHGNFSYFASQGATNREPVVTLDSGTTAGSGFTIQFGSLVGTPSQYNTWAANMPLITVSVP